MKKILITGLTGFAGTHLAHLLSQNPENSLSGTYYSQDSVEQLGDLAKSIDLHKVDMTQKDQVDALIAATNPDEVYHLAAQTSPSDSIKDPQATYLTNISSQSYLFEALKSHNNTKILIISTSEIYGAVLSSDLPIDEDTPLRPVTPYAVSKIACDYMALQYAIAEKMHIIRVRPFNHIGPGQAPKFVLPSFAKQVAAIEKGEQEPVMKVGNLAARKDFSDVRDIVRAYVFLMEKGEAGDVYNVGAGKSVTIQDLLDMLLKQSKKEIRVEVDPQFFRPIDTPDVVCDTTKIATLTGWKPEISIEQTITDTLDYFRKVI